MVLKFHVRNRWHVGTKDGVKTIPQKRLNIFKLHTYETYSKI